ncbi:MAG: glycosyltransferase family 2 protein [Lachnospiraceae bacterium]|nr:glycosyltransferase family 2 protein [Lachnospiraceae bacterium]
MTDRPEDALKREQRRNAVLAERVTLLEEQNALLREKLDRVKTHPLWKASAPLRAVLRTVSHNLQRVRRQGSVRGVVRKLKNKQLEKRLMADYGTNSFPSDAEREAQQEESARLAERIRARVYGAQGAPEADARPVFSILVPLYNTPEAFLRDMIESVLAQTFGSAELCLADGSDDAHGYVERVVREYTDDNRGTVLLYSPVIRYQRLAENKGISANTNACLAMAKGAYIGLLDHDDILHPEALYLYAKEIDAHGADYLYSDETTFAGGDGVARPKTTGPFMPQAINRMLTMHFKPDYAVDNLRANNYICHFSVFRKDLLEGDELFRPRFDGSQDHDMILRLTDRARNIVHVPRILYYWRSHAGSTAAGIEAKTYAIDAAKGAVADHLKRHGFEHFRITSTRAFETIFKISYEISSNPKISIVIPSRDHADDLKRCIDSIVEKSTWDNYEIIVVENGSTEEKTFAYYEELKSLQSRGRSFCRVFDFRTGPENRQKDGLQDPPASFNFADLVNFGVSQAEGDYVLLLNNDTGVIAANWMEELLMYAQRDDVGAVGAKLYFPDDTIQHAGVVLGLGAHRTAGHSHYGESKENLGYMGRLCYAQNVSAVTGACLMVARETFDEVNGFDPAFAVSLNDIDFCLRLREKGYLNVFTPFSTLYHHESKSRGLDTDGEKAARYERESALFRERWKALLEAGDPYYNPNFSLDHADFRLRA